MATVTLRGIHKRYGRHVTALEGLDLTIEDGHFVCLLGPSGSGKSTILKLIAGIEEVTSGQILFDGQDVTHVLPERRDIAMVFQSYALYPTMSVFDNIAFPLRVRKLKKDEIRRRVESAAAMLGIQALLRRQPRELSGGERQRVALGRAIVREPKVFLLDEPLSNLDYNLRMQMRQELKRLHNLLGATFVYVTHDQDDALAMGDRVGILSNGQLEQYASTADIYDVPATRFVASFIGRPPMNFFDGELIRHDETLTFRNDDLRLRLPHGLDIDGLPVPATMGIRPEAITPCGPDDRCSHLAGTVNDVAVIQPNIYLTIAIGSHTVMARLPEGTPWPGQGQPAKLKVDLDKVHLFDAKMERRLGVKAPAAPLPELT